MESYICCMTPVYFNSDTPSKYQWSTGRWVARGEHTHIHSCMIAHTQITHNHKQKNYKNIDDDKWTFMVKKSVVICWQVHILSHFPPGEMLKPFAWNYYRLVNRSVLTAKTSCLELLNIYVQQVSSWLLFFFFSFFPWNYYWVVNRSVPLLKALAWN